MCHDQCYCTFDSRPRPLGSPYFLLRSPCCFSISYSLLPDSACARLARQLPPSPFLLVFAAHFSNFLLIMQILDACRPCVHLTLPTFLFLLYHQFLCLTSVHFIYQYLLLAILLLPHLILLMLLYVFLIHFYLCGFYRPSDP